MIRPYDAWTLRRLLVGHDLNGELEAVSEEFRPIGGRLAALDIEARQGAWNEFLEGHPAPTGIIKALAEVDPSGPAPDIEADESGEDERTEGRDDPPPADPEGCWPTLAPGMCVMATDLDPPNYGHVVADLGSRASVHFVSPTGFEAIVTLPKAVLRRPDGSPLTSDQDGGEWQPLRFEGLPLVDPFPLDVLPEPAARLVREGAEAIGCPPDFLGVPALAVAAGAIGRSVCLMLKDGYFASVTLYVGNVGPPSDGKTPAQKAVAGAVRRIDAVLEAEHAQALERWRDSAERPAPDGKKQKPPPPPKPRRIDVDDITMEALPVILADNPRGLIMVRDELTAFVLGMNQFKGGKGNDRSNALKIWSGDAIKKDRVNHEDNVPTRCPHPCLTIVGGLPPDMLGELLDPKGRTDGFIDRFLLTYPDPLPVADWTERGVPEETAEDWYDLVARLWARPLSFKEGRAVPHVAHFTPEGKACWQAHYNAHAAEMNRDDFPPKLRGPWGKFREYAGRLTLILALMDHAADPTADPLAVPRVGPRIVEDAWKLIGYFKSHARRVHAAIALGPGIGGGHVVKAIVDWIRSGRRLSFSERDIKQTRRWITPSDLADALKFLAERNAIRPRGAPTDKPKGGRPPSPGYDVNPALLDSQNSQNAQNPGLTWVEDQPFERSEGSEY